MIIVILGMHKSGTTMVSEILHHSGISMGDFPESTSYDRGHKYERKSTLALNMDILGAGDFEILDLVRVDGARFPPEHRRKMKGIIAECEEGGEDWGFKDPRSTLVYDLWAQELPAHKIIGVFRDPAHIWPRFKWMGKRKYHTNFHRAYSFLCRWEEHNAQLISILENSSQDCLALNYHEFMVTNEPFKKLEEFVGQKLEDRRNPSLYRSQAGPDFFLKTANRILEQRRSITYQQILAQLQNLT